MTKPPGPKRVSSGFTGSMPSCASRQVAARSGISGVVPGAKNRTPTASTTRRCANLFRAADQQRRSFSGDDRAQYETEDHRGAGSDHNAGHHFGKENPDGDTEDCGGRDRQRDIGRCRPGTVDRTSPFPAVMYLLRSSHAMRAWKSDPHCSMGQEPTTGRSGHVRALRQPKLR